MTAEVAVLNKSAVAIAADSAVTTGFPGREKIYTTANKIFTLSKLAPVGVMINGNVQHFGYPWEVLIKTCRADLKTERLPDLTEYALRLKDFICDTRFMSDDGQDVTVLLAALSTANEVYRRIEGDNQLRIEWTSSKIKGKLQEMLDYAEGRPFVPGCETITVKQFSEKYQRLVDDALDDEEHVYRRIPIVCRSLFRKVVHAVLARQMEGQFSSGIVVVGYGEDNLFPKLQELRVDGGFLGRFRCLRG